MDLDRRRRPETEILEKLRSLADRLKAAQHKLIDAAAASNVMPTDGIIAKIAALENSIVAVETLIAERSEKGS